MEEFSWRLVFGFSLSRGSFTFAKTTGTDISAVQIPASATCIVMLVAAGPDTSFLQRPVNLSDGLSYKAGSPREQPYEPRSTRSRSRRDTSESDTAMTITFHRVDSPKLQFPIKLIRAGQMPEQVGEDEFSAIRSTIFAYALLARASELGAKSGDAPADSIVSPNSILIAQSLLDDSSDASLNSWAADLRITLPQFKLDEFAAKLQRTLAADGGNKLVVMPGGLLGQLPEGASFRDFSVLSAVAAGVGDRPSARLAFAEITALSLGYSNETELPLELAAQLENNQVWRKVQFTVKKLNKLALLASLTYRRRHKYYSLRWRSEPQQLAQHIAQLHFSQQPQTVVSNASIDDEMRKLAAGNPARHSSPAASSVEVHRTDATHIQTNSPHIGGALPAKAGSMQAMQAEPAFVAAQESQPIAPTSPNAEAKPAAQPAGWKNEGESLTSHGTDTENASVDATQQNEVVSDPSQPVLPTGEIPARLRTERVSNLWANLLAKYQEQSRDNQLPEFETRRTWLNHLNFLGEAKAFAALSISLSESRSGCLVMSMTEERLIAWLKANSPSDYTKVQQAAIARSPSPIAGPKTHRGVPHFAARPITQQMRSSGFSNH